MDEKEEIGYNMDQPHQEKILRSGGKLFLKDPEKALTTHRPKIRVIQCRLVLA
jgi:hypothetical protein